MTKTAGMDAVFKKGGTPIAGVRVSGFTRDATPIDVTDKDSKGFAEMLSGKHASASLSLNIEGLEEDGVLQGIALDPEANWLLDDVTLELSNGHTLGGDFWFGNYTEGNPHDNATTFSGSLTSSGKWTFAATV